MRMINRQNNPKITRDDTFLPFQSSSIPPDALASSLPDEAVIWKQAIDQMLAWKWSPPQLPPEDQPSDEILNTAIDYAVDQMEQSRGACAPNNIAPSGSGRIAMEWNCFGETIILEFIDQGKATYTMFNGGGKIVERHILVRNPRSRELERRD